MFTVHGTRKLLDRVKAPVVEPCVPTTLLGNWYATALFWKPRQVALLVNEQTLVPVFVPLAPAVSLADRLGRSVGLVLEALGVGIDVVLQETEEMADVSFAKTANRSVIGSMNEFAYHAEFHNAEGWDDLTAIAVDLAHMPCGPLYKTHVRPVDALHAAIAEATGQPFAGGRRKRSSQSDVSALRPSEPSEMLIADLSHFDDLPANAAPELWALAEHLQSITSAATSQPSGKSWASAVRCISTATTGDCPGPISVKRNDVPASIEWSCVKCGYAGTISGWKGSAFDLSDTVIDQSGDRQRHSIVVTPQTHTMLRSVLILDPDCERLIHAAMTTERGIELSGDIDDLEQLIGFVASEANHEENPGRRNLLDACLDSLTEAFDRLT